MRTLTEQNRKQARLWVRLRLLRRILLYTKQPFTAEEEAFLDRGAGCLMDRELRLGCRATHNVEEQEDEQDWIKLCFPRFYLYDVLRGLAFILKWSEKRRQMIPTKAIRKVVAELTEKFSDGDVRLERLAYEGIVTRIMTPAGEWSRVPQATLFPLLSQVSGIGQGSPYLTAQWNDCRQLIKKLTVLELIV